MAGLAIKHNSLIAFFLLAAVFAGSWCFAGVGQQNVCHVRIFHSSSEIPIRDVFIKIATASFVALFVIVAANGAKSAFSHRSEKEGISFETKRSPVLLAAQNPLDEFLSQGILHPKLYGAAPAQVRIELAHAHA